MDKTIATPEEKLRRGLRNLAWAMFILCGVLILLFAWSRTGYWGHGFAGYLLWYYLPLLFLCILQWFYFKRHGLALYASKQKLYRFYGWQAVGFGVLWLMSLLLALLLPHWANILVEFGSSYSFGGFYYFIFWYRTKFVDLGPPPADNKGQERQA